MQYALTDNDRIVKCYSTSGETYYIRHLDLGIPIKIFTCNCPSFQFRDVLSCKHIDQMPTKYIHKMEGR